MLDRNLKIRVDCRSKLIYILSLLNDIHYMVYCMYIQVSVFEVTDPTMAPVAEVFGKQVLYIYMMYIF